MSGSSTVDGGIFNNSRNFFIGASLSEVDSPRLPLHLSEYERDTLLVHPEVKSLLTFSAFYRIYIIYIYAYVHLTPAFLPKLYVYASFYRK